MSGENTALSRENLALMLLEEAHIFTTYSLQGF